MSDIHTPPPPPQSENSAGAGSPDNAPLSLGQKLLRTFLGLVILLIAAFIYVQTGEDVLGIFQPEQQVWSVYFTNPITISNPTQLEESVAGRLIFLIDDAQERIDIAAFEFDLEPVALALMRARQRGVAIRWMTDDDYGLEADAEEAKLFPRLMRTGIEVRSDQRSGLMHHKFWIFDNRTLWTGSTNMTENGIYRNNNNVVVVESPELAAIFGREFEEMWAGEFGPKSPSTVDSQSILVGDMPVQALFAPEDPVVEELIARISQAEHSVLFMAFSFTQPDLGDAVLAQADQGVAVRGVFEVRGSETEYSQLGRMACAGLQVRQDGNSRTFHHKVFVLDEETVITGSFNFSNNAIHANEENVLILQNREIARLFIQEFERRWSEAVGPDGINCS